MSFGNIRTISLFSGSGGLDLGLLQTGRFKIVLANDINKHACETYKHNIGNHIVCADIQSLNTLPEAELIVGGPPCQGFSLANPNRAFDDPRNWLFKEYVRILNEVKPYVFLMENVSGILTLEAGNVFKIIKRGFEECGYRLTEKLLNAVDYEVPQSRNRLILVGVRKDIEEKYKFPDPVIIPPLFGSYRTVKEAILDTEIDTNDLNHSIGELSYLNKKRLNHIPPGGSMQDCPPELHNNSDLKRAMRRLTPDKPSYTIVHNNCDHYYHPTQLRRITIREMALLQSYPKDFVFLGSKSEQSRQVGNSVAIRFAYHLGLSISDFFDRVSKVAPLANQSSNTQLRNTSKTVASAA
jgi:DNA (cytosine-5)-methyltransferase 1